MVACARVGLSVSCDVKFAQCLTSFDLGGIEHRFLQEGSFCLGKLSYAKIDLVALHGKFIYLQLCDATALITHVSFEMIPLALLIFQFEQTTAMFSSITVRVGSI